MSARKIIRPNWSFSVIVLGEDLLVEGARATWFGGSNDPMDAGETACGFPTRGNPGLLACSLPMDYRGAHAATRRACGGSPIPMLPWGLTSTGEPRPGGTHVIVTRGDQSLSLPLIDIGPARWTGHAIDLTRAAFRALGGSLSQGVAVVNYRIPGAAKYLPHA